MKEKAEVRGGQMPPIPKRCKNCGHPQEDHDKEKGCKKEGCICPSFRYDLGADMAMLGITAGIGGLLSSMFLSEGKKMFGMGSGDVQINGKDVMYVMIDGFMGYYNEKLEEINTLKGQVAALKEEAEDSKQRYDEAIAVAQKNADMAKEWQSKYMALVSKSRKR